MTLHLFHCREGASDGPLEQLQRALRQADRELSRSLERAAQLAADRTQAFMAPPLSPVRRA